MNTNRLKVMYEKLPRGIKKMLSAVFIHLMVDSKEFVRTIKELDEFEMMDSAEQERKQLELLKQTLVDAYRNVPFYKDRFDKVGFDPEKCHLPEDIKKIPVLTKEDAINAGDRLYSTDNMAYYESVTGGSSGHALKVMLDQVSIYKERAFICHYLSKFGYDKKKSRTLALIGHQNDSDYYYSPLKNEIVISPFLLFSEEGFERAWKAIQDFNPTCIAGYPSAINMLAQLVEKQKLRHHFDFACYYAENCSDEVRENIKRVFHCKVIGYYGHTERAVFAEEYGDKGCYRFNRMYGFTEYLPTEVEGEYQIACTGFISKKMPLIRYVTDDVVTMDKDGVVRIIGHRRSEVCLISKSGARIFKGALTIHLDVLKKAKQYQFVQEERGKAYFDIVPCEEICKADMIAIQDYLDKRCNGELDVTIRIVERIQLTNRGKYNWAVVKIPTA